MKNLKYFFAASIFLLGAFTSSSLDAQETLYSLKEKTLLKNNLITAPLNITFSDQPSPEGHDDYSVFRLGHCRININLNNLGHLELYQIIYPENKQSSQEIDLFKKYEKIFTYFHEAAHCEQALNKNLFVFNNPEFSFSQNQLIHQMANNNFYQLFYEMFADIYGSILFLKDQSSSQQPLEFLTLIANLRHDTINYARQNNIDDEHKTHFALKKVLNQYSLWQDLPSDQLKQYAYNLSIKMMIPVIQENPQAYFTAQPKLNRLNLFFINLANHLKLDPPQFSPDQEDHIQHQQLIKTFTKN